MNFRFDLTQKRKSAKIIFFVMLIFIFGTACQGEPEPDVEQVSVVQFENANAFNIQYPSAWGETIIREGQMVFAHPNTLNLEEPGPSMLVVRVPGTASDRDVAEEFDHFITNGPLRSGYEMLEERREEATIVAGAIEASVINEAEDTQGYVSVVKANESNATYILTATAPIETWERSWTLFQVMLQSFELNE